MAMVKAVVPKTSTPTGFDERVLSRTAQVAVIGLGYVGLPLAVAHAQRGFRVIGVDIDQHKIALLAAGRSYIKDVPSKDVAGVAAVGRFFISTSYAPLKQADVVFICVPTPCTKNKQPDTSMIQAAAESIRQHLSRGQLVILRSTSYPGTTDELVKPILERGGMKLGKDFFLAFAPERVDPGRKDYAIHNTPVIVGGCDPESTRRATLLLGQVVNRVVSVSSPAAAEMSKLLENVFRNVNIALVNQLARLCDRMKLNIWEIIDAAATKPYGFQAFQPGPGVGGHCIPVDPYYLAWKALEYDFHMDFIELAARVNDEMPYYVAQKVMLHVNGSRHTSSASSVLVVGVSFKRDIDDFRDSPALKIIQLLEGQGARVSYHDPYVPSLVVNGKTYKSAPLSEQTLKSADCTVIVTDHSALDYDFIVRHSRRVFDTRHATRRVKHGREKVVKL